MFIALSKYYGRRVFGQKLGVIIIFFLAYNPVLSQYKLHGSVYDETGIFPLHAVSVICSSGKGTITDSTGHYTLIVAEKDSVWFSYLSKETQKFAFDEIPDLSDFNISLHTNISVLREVKVRPPNYRLDSILNRTDYAKVFNYKKPTFGSVVEAISITGIVIDIDEMIRVFQYRQKKMMLGFQVRLLDEEHRKFILHRFTKLLISEITGSIGEKLDSFMFRFMPSYSFTLQSSDYTFRIYIKEKYEIYKSVFSGDRKPEE